MSNNKLKRINELNENYILQKSNIINEFLWSCAGVNKDILRKCPNEYAKYAGVGGTILFTALMAMISGGYAMFFVFESTIASLLFAVFWGLLIFNLDRFIVNSMYVDDSPYLNWAKLKAALPRFIMAIFLGLVISTPLEMKIFNDKIESQLITDNITRVNETKGKSNDYDQLKTLKLEQTKLLGERKTLNDELLKAQKELKEEGEGNALSGKAGHGPIYEDKLKYVEQCQQSLSEWDNINQDELKNLQTRITSLSDNITKIEKTANDIYDSGFIARYEAFSNLKEGNITLTIISLMITMLFIIIEIIPTFFKLVMEHGLYDKLCKSEEEIIKTLSLSKQEEIENSIKDIKNSQEHILARQDELHRQELWQQQQKYLIERQQWDLNTAKNELMAKSDLLDKRLEEITIRDNKIKELESIIEDNKVSIKKLKNDNSLLERKIPKNQKKKKRRK